MSAWAQIEATFVLNYGWDKWLMFGPRLVLTVVPGTVVVEGSTGRRFPRTS